MTAREYERTAEFVRRVIARGMTDLCMVRMDCDMDCKFSPSADCVRRNLEYLQTGVHKAKTQAAASDIDGLMSAMGV